MGRMMMRKRMDEHGLSLVEVVASIVILTMMLTTFMMIFVQSAKTNKASSDIVDATYIAQTAMENIYGEKVNGKIKALGNLHYIEDNVPGEWDRYKKNDDSGYLIKTRFKPVDGYGNMDHVIVEVFENPEKTTPKAKMQNIVVWGPDGS